jgi:nucleoside-diphosphate-sugar epimerase
MRRLPVESEQGDTPLSRQQQMLVTGGSEFIGWHLVAAQLDRGSWAQIPDTLNPTIPGADPCQREARRANWREPAATW